jgi:hypothetical protein
VKNRGIKFLTFNFIEPWNFEGVFGHGICGQKLHRIFSQSLFEFYKNLSPIDKKNVFIIILK